MDDINDYREELKELMKEAINDGLNPLRVATETEALASEFYHKAEGRLAARVRESGFDGLDPNGAAHRAKDSKERR